MGFQIFGTAHLKPLDVGENYARCICIPTQKKTRDACPFHQERVRVFPSDPVDLL